VVKPVFMKKAGSAATISPGVSYYIDCNAAGQPLPVIVWKKDGQLLDHFNHTKYGSSVYTVTLFDYLSCILVVVRGF